MTNAHEAVRQDRSGLVVAFIIAIAALAFFAPNLPAGLREYLSALFVR